MKNKKLKNGNYKFYKLSTKIPFLIKNLFFFNLLIYFFIQKIKLKNKLNEQKKNIMKNLKSFSLKKNVFFFLKKRPNKLKSSLIIKEKEELLNMISKSVGRKITYFNSIFLSQKLMFGNQIILINIIIFYCEILGCKRIILDKNWNWFIKNRIYYRKYRILIKVGEVNKFKSDTGVIDCSTNFFYYSKYIKPELRMNVIKKEILNNIPKFKTNLNDLYIYIRSGDIFIRVYNHLYAQPPLCFYKEIINNNKFDNIYIISKIKNNPVINALIKQNSNIKYKKNNLKDDIGILVYCYNMVGAISTFNNIIMHLNDNLINYWEFNIDSIVAKISHFHYFLYHLNKKINIYRMKPADKYLNKMRYWTNSKYQRNLMIKEKCPNKFQKYNY